jgi:Protein of unknown function (DUF3034)
MTRFFSSVRRRAGLVAVIMSLCLLPKLVHAQGLNWDGQTGAFVTPFAYTSGSPGSGFGAPQLSFHYLDVGNVIGGHFQSSVTVGALGVTEFGYTRTSQTQGSDPTLSPLFQGGYNTFHLNAAFLKENAGQMGWVPQLAVGGVLRTNIRRVGGVIVSDDSSNGDVYMVGTKTMKSIPHVPVIINFGVKATNASLMGIAGNSPAWKARTFGALAFVLPSLSGSKLVLGSEFLQQPRDIEGLPGAVVPTTLTYFARIIPVPEKPFNIDFGASQIAGRVLPGVDLGARAQFGVGISYRF